ncbi:hypothetical protein MKW94_018208 [Papaver nudicaule]|uniref:Uncharacterized protein n=1 Tax=Papaver nudicaule TaxID=74823 RepID=A0AA41S4R8_PAPNU|nr:hypothetical protein [Papaver nudicaule]
MGSLVAGWDSKSVTCQRNNSCTNEEIEAYWKSKEPVFEKENCSRRVIDQENTSEKKSGRTGKLRRLGSLPLIDRKGNIHDVDESAMDKLIKTNNWWTRTNWAYLNEPPVIAATDQEGRALYRYTPQYHVATGLISILEP